MNRPSDDPGQDRLHTDGRDPVAIFDLDGTLIDTAADVGRALNPTLRERGMPELDPLQAAKLMGHGLQRFAQGAFARHGQAPDENDIAAFIARYARDPVTDTRPYPDVPETLDALRAAGWRLVVCTNKMENLATDILDRLGLLARFDTVCGSDQSPARKPDPRHLAATLARADLIGHPAVMIGDFTADLGAAQAFGIPSIFARWGYGDPTLARDATLSAGHFRELPALLESLVAR